MRTMMLAATLALFGCSASAEAPYGEGAELTLDRALGIQEYPAGPYGQGRGDVMPNLTWQVYRDGEWSTLSLGDYYDPDGSRGIHAIYLVAFVLWCPSSVEAAVNLGTAYPEDRPRGARYLAVLMEDRSGKPATKELANEWSKAHPSSVDLAIDPAKTLTLSADGGYPFGLLIDPRTMQVVRRNGGDASPHGVGTLIAANTTP